MFLIFHLSSRQILIPACVPQTGLSCLPPSNPDCHPESSKKYTLPGKQYKLAHRFGFVFFFPHQTAWFQNAQKVRAKANSLSVPPTTDMHIHELLNPGNQKRERGQPSIASHHIHMYMCMYTYIYIYGERESTIGFPRWYRGKEPASQCRRGRRLIQSQGQEGPLEQGLATHSSVLAWRISWTEETGRLQSTG